MSDPKKALTDLKRKYGVSTSVEKTEETKPEPQAIKPAASVATKTAPKKALDALKEKYISADHTDRRTSTGRDSGVRSSYANRYTDTAAINSNLERLSSSLEAGEKALADLEAAYNTNPSEDAANAYNEQAKQYNADLTAYNEYVHRYNYAYSTDGIMLREANARWKVEDAQQRFFEASVAYANSAEYPEEMRVKAYEDRQTAKEEYDKAVAALEAIQTNPYDIDPEAYQTAPDSKYLQMAKDAYAATIATDNTGENSAEIAELEERLSELKAEEAKANQMLSDYSRGNAANTKSARDTVARLTEIAKEIEETESRIAQLKQPVYISRVDQIAIEKEALLEQIQSLSAYTAQFSAVDSPEEKAQYMEASAELVRLYEEVAYLDQEADMYERFIKFGEKEYEDKFRGQFNANFRLADTTYRANEATDKALATGDERDWAYAEALTELEKLLSWNNQEALDDEGAQAKWISKTAAGYLPQFGRQTAAKAAGGIGGAVLGSAVGHPVAGASAGAAITSGYESHGQMRGAAYRALIEAGVDEETALEAAKDEALISSIIESIDTAGEVLSLGGYSAVKAVGTATVKAASKPGASAAVKAAAKIIGKQGTKMAAKTAVKGVSRGILHRVVTGVFQIGLNAVQEYAEEAVQEGVSIANQRRALEGRTGEKDLMNETFDVFGGVFSGEDPISKRQIMGAGEEGGKVGLMFGGVTIAQNTAITAGLNHNTAQQVGKEYRGKEQQIIRYGLSKDKNTSAYKQAQKLSGKENISDAELGRLVYAVKLAETEAQIEMVKDDPEIMDALIQEGKDSGKGTVAAKIAAEIEEKRANGKQVTTYDVERLIAANNAYIGAEEKAAQGEKQQGPGYGRHGVAAFEQILARSDESYDYVQARFNAAYEFGASNGSLIPAVLTDPIYEAAYMAGRKDYVDSLAVDIDNSLRATVYGKDSGIIPTDAAKKMDASTLDLIGQMSKDLGIKTRVKEAVWAVDSEGNRREANGGLTDAGIFELSLTAEKPLLTVAVHEGTHRMKQLDPESYRAFRDFAVQMSTDYKDILASGAPQVTAVEAKWADYGRFAATTEKTMDEIAAEYAERLFSDEATLREAISAADKNEDVRNTLQKFFDFIRDTIRRLKQSVRNLRSRGKSAEATELKGTVSEMEKALQLWTEAYEASKKAAEKLTAKAEKKTANEAGRTDNDSGTMLSAKAQRGRSIELETMENNRIQRLRQFHDDLPPQWYAYTGAYFYLYSNHSFMDYTILAKVRITDKNLPEINKFEEMIKNGTFKPAETFDCWTSYFRRGKGRYSWDSVRTGNREAAMRSDGMDERAQGSNRVGHSQENSGVGEGITAPEEDVRWSLITDKGDSVMDAAMERLIAASVSNIMTQRTNRDAAPALASNVTGGTGNAAVQANTDRARGGETVKAHRELDRLNARRAQKQALQEQGQAVMQAGKTVELINRAIRMEGTRSQELARKLRDKGLYNNEAAVGELYAQMVRDGGDMAFMHEGESVRDTELRNHDVINIENSAVETYNKSDTPKTPKVFTDNPFDETGKLKPNIRYQAGEFGYYYETDADGRISRWYSDDLQLTDREERLRHDPNSPGKLDGDHAGHLVGDRFGGSPKLDNLVSQSKNVNLSQYRTLENKWAKAISEGKKVLVSVDVKYEGSGLRPVRFDVRYMIAGTIYKNSIHN